MGHIKKGELTQEEKELLEVIGKGTGAGLVSGRCTPGRRALRSPERAPQARRTLGNLQSGKAFLSLAGDGLQGRWEPFWMGGRSIAAIRSRFPSLDLYISFLETD